MKLAWTAATFLAISVVASAQEKPLGDVAREARAQTSQAGHANKVVTNDDFAPHLDPVTDDETPVGAVNKSRTALLNDRSHSCLREASGNSGPGWTDNRLTEIAAPDRVRITVISTKPALSRSEFIIIGPDVYRRTVNAPWEKVTVGEAKLMSGARLDLPDVLNFRFENGDLKLIGRESVDGVVAVRCQYKVRVVDMDRTIDIWIRASDHLPVRTHMLTVTTSALTAPVTWQESATCSYGQHFNIVPPM